MEEKKILLRYCLLPIVIVGLLWVAVAPSKRLGYKPTQPFNFNHNKHAGIYNIDCQYCHAGVSYSKEAGVPSISTCRNCHATIATDRPKIEKLNKLWETKTPVEWVRVHNLPDHVRFSHSVHLKAFAKENQETKVTCAKCHGDVSNMKVIQQVKTLNMGFCIDCHRENVDKGAKTDCSTCHY